MLNEQVESYELSEQVGHLLRRAHQRHKAIFAEEMPIKLPPTQFAALATLSLIPRSDRPAVLNFLRLLAGDQL